MGMVELVLLKKILNLFMCMGMCVYMYVCMHVYEHICLGACRGEKTASDLLELPDQDAGK